jgi:hypothetical protein
MNILDVTALEQVTTNTPIVISFIKFRANYRCYFEEIAFHMTLTCQLVKLPLFRLSQTLYLCITWKTHVNINK